MQDTKGWKSIGEWVVVDENPPPKNQAILTGASLEKTQTSVTCTVLLDTEDGEFVAGQEIEANTIIKSEVRVGNRLYSAIPRYNVIARREQS